MRLVTLLTAAFCVAAAALPTARAHAEWNDSIRWHAEVGTTLSAGEHTPLWLNANRFGFSSIERNNFWLRLGAFKELDKHTMAAQMSPRERLQLRLTGFGFRLLVQRYEKAL